MEGVVVVAAQDEQVGPGLGPLQPDGKAPVVLRKRVQREQNPLHPKGLAPKRMRLGHWPGGSRQTSAEEEGQRTRGLSRGFKQWQLEHARVQFGSW